MTMISIADILLPEDILLDLEVAAPRAFDEVGQTMQRWHGLPRVVVAEALAQREAFGSTALGLGVAIPHGRIKGLNQSHAAYVRP
jgi:PTS system nitrogen regulatory IIA component